MTANETVSLHYSLEGPEHAPVLVLSNSLGTASRMWDAQASALQERFRLLRYDHRGHGESPVPSGSYTVEDLGRDVIALLYRLEIDTYTFCGLSLGGMVGMWLASEAPERIERLVLCCTSASLGPPENWSSRADTVRKDGMDEISEAVLERWFTPEFRSSNPGTVEWAGRMLIETPAEGYAGCCEAIRDMDLRDRLAEIQAPTLVVAGADDEAITLDHAELLRDSIPDSRLEVVPQAAHLANVEQPEALTQAVLEHLDPVLEERQR